MRLGANRDGRRPGTPAAYWRRRCFILGAGLATLAVLAWQFTSARPAPAAAQAGDVLPSAAYGSPWASPSPTPSLVPARAACAPASIVLSVFPSQASYRQGTQPQFEVYAVSTAAEPCRMVFGPGSVRVIVTSRGRVVWDSAACGQAPAAMVSFEPGVPQLAVISWNRTTSHPAGCAGSLPVRASGTFEVVAMSAGRSSTPRSVTLLR